MGDIERERDMIELLLAHRGVTVIEASDKGENYVFKIRVPKLGDRQCI